MRSEVIFPFELATGSRQILKGEALENLCCWKLRAGEAISVRGNDRLYRARLLRMGEKDAEVLIYEEMGEVAHGPTLMLLQAVPQKERMELIIQKACELGVDIIVPLTSNKSITIAERDALQKKSHKWPEVARKAAIQSRRSTIPVIYPSITLDEAVASIDGDLKLIFWEGSKTDLKDVLRRANAPVSIIALIGPEGGLEDSEVQKAALNGFLPVRNGCRVMRTETAAISAVSILRYALGG